MNTPMSPERLAGIAARTEAATPGPWDAYESDCDMHVGRSPDGPHVALFGRASWHDVPADATFVAHARQDVPDLLAEVERLRVALELFRTADTECIVDCPGCETGGAS